MTANDVVQALKVQFQPGNGGWYAGGREWSVKSMEGDKLTIRSCDTKDTDEVDHDIEVTIRVSKPKRVRA